MFFKLSKVVSDLTDSELLNRYMQHSDRRALEVLFCRYALHVYGTCRHYIANDWDAQDAVMDVFELVQQELRKKPVIRKFKDWLFIITRNFCYRRIERRSRVAELLTEWKENNADSFVQNPGETALYEEKNYQIDAVLDALNELDSKQQQCLTEFYLNGKSYKVIAEELSWEVSEVRTAIQNGRRNLRIRFGVK